jgi:hypothetical protein
MHYDVQPLALPMALIVVRSVMSRSKAGITLAAVVVFLIVIDLCNLNLAGQDNLRDMLVLVAVMALGLRSLTKEASRASQGRSCAYPEMEAHNLETLEPQPTQ